MSISTPARTCRVAALVAAAACTSSDVPAVQRASQAPQTASTALVTSRDPAQTVAAATSCPRPDTTDIIDKWSVTFSNPSIAQMDSLDRRIAAATPAQLPALLFARGRARAAFAADREGPNGAYAKAHEGAFFYNEVGGEWLTTGTDFDTLIARFPASEFADEAAWAVARLPGGGECEGSYACYVARAWVPMRRFLSARPASPRGDVAVTLAIRAFDLLDQVEDLRVERDDNEIRGVEPLLAQFDSTGRKLPAPRSARILLRAGELWERYLNYDRARDAYRAAAGADPAYRACADEHLAAIPSRWFTQDTANTISDHRVDLRWQNPGAGVTGFTITRWTSRWEPKTTFAHIDAAARTWSDTTAVAGATNWYRVDAEMPDGRLPSNPVLARTPPRDARFSTSAVSTTDKRLYLFGVLANHFPHVMIVSQDGKVEHRDAMVVGPESWNNGAGFADRYTSEVWLADANGRGVMRFAKPGPGYPPELTSAVRRGKELLYLDTVPAHPTIVAVDEPARAAWVASAKNAGIYPDLLNAVGSMDCVAETSECWIAYPGRVDLLGSSGETKLTVTLPRGNEDKPGTYGSIVHANPRDNSAWIFVPRLGRVLHADKSGKVQFEMALTDSAHAWFVSIAMDREAQKLWYVRPPANRALCKDRFQCPLELVQLDLGAAQPTPKVVASGLPEDGHLLSDLSGGVWWITMYKVQRIDASGRVVVTIPLRPDY